MRVELAVKNDPNRPPQYFLKTIPFQQVLT